MDRLPIDITTAIIANLPVESVLRCRSVCKTWCSVIDNPKFRALHTKSSQINNPSSSTMLIPERYQGQMFILQNLDDPDLGFPKCSPIKIPLQDKFDCMFFVGSCNGLFCFRSWDGHCGLDGWGGQCGLDAGGDFMWVCNPATRESVTVPQVKLSKPIRFERVASGFGLTHSTKEFKIINVFYPSKPQAQVLTLGSNSWRVIGDAPPRGMIMFGRQVLLDGYVYWLNISNFPFGPSIGVTSFDLESEIFESIPIPEFGFKTNLSDILILGLLDGSLCITNNSSKDDANEIWVKKENNVWIKQFVISRNVMDEMKTWVLSPIRVGKNGELILLCEIYASHSLISYNIETGIVVPLEIEKPTVRFYAEPFTESLISPHISQC